MQTLRVCKHARMYVLGIFCDENVTWTVVMKIYESGPSPNGMMIL